MNFFNYIVVVYDNIKEASHIYMEGYDIALSVYTFALLYRKHKHASVESGISIAGEKWKTITLGWTSLQPKTSCDPLHRSQHM